MSILDQHWFSNISHPSRYIGNEINSIRKDLKKTEVSIALVFPDVYEVGMSHLGLKILYHILNSQHWLAAERAFSPWIDLEKELRSHQIPITTLESGRPLSSFDIIGFSLQHELSYTNVLNILDLAGIPFLATERKDEDPLIIAGGPACFNPEPIAEIFDVMVIGDGEAVTLELCQTVRKAKQRNISGKRELLFQLCHIKGIYIPSFFRIHYSPEGSINEIEPLVPEYKVVRKAILPDIDGYPFPLHQIVSFMELIHDRIVIEIARGCTRGCRFCQAGMIYRPVRERSPESILEKAKEVLRLTGHEDLSLMSLSSGDYSCIEPLLKALMDRQSSEKVAVSLPSLRVDSLSPSSIEQIKRVRKTGFTLAPEAGNDRLRGIINKGLTQNDILETAQEVYDAGWNLIKLYFMIGLPFEEETDLHDIIDLVKQITSLGAKRGKRSKLNVSISTFVPKSHTPFMWTPQIPIGESQRRIQLIREGLKGSRVRVKWNQPELSWLEGIFSRGDRRLTKTLIEAWKLGAKFDAWSQHLKMEIWEKALTRTGLDPCFYLHRERFPDEIMPWDHIISGVTKIFLETEWERAQQGESTSDCREKCLECGVCDHTTIDPVLFRNWGFSYNLNKPLLGPVISPSKKYRLTFSKLNHARYLSHLELVRVFIRAFRRAGLSLVYSRGFHPMPKVSFGCALPVGTESMQETVDIEVVEPFDSQYLKETINQQLPLGITVSVIEEVSSNKKNAHLKESHFIITLNGIKLREEDLKGFLKSGYFPVIKVNKKGKQEINARPLVRSMSLISSNQIRMALRHTSGPELKPAEIVRSVFSLKDYSANEINVLKTRQIFE